MNVRIFAVLLRDEVVTAKFGYHMKVQIFGVLLQNLAITFIENGIYSSGGNRGFIFNRHYKNRLKFTLFGNLA